MEEMNAGIEQAAAKLKSGEGLDEQEPGRRRRSTETMGQID